MFLPSEISRLVLGYLMQLGCNQASEAFLCECKHLEEYAQSLEDDFEYPLTIGGKSLINILTEYSLLKRKVQNEQSSTQTEKQTSLKALKISQSPQSSSSIKRRLDVERIKNRRSGNMFTTAEPPYGTTSVQQNSSPLSKNRDGIESDFCCSLPPSTQNIIHPLVSKASNFTRTSTLAANSTIFKVPTSSSIQSAIASKPTENLNSPLLHSDNVDQNISRSPPQFATASSNYSINTSHSQFVQVPSPSYNNAVNDRQHVEIQDITPTIQHVQIPDDVHIGQINQPSSNSSPSVRVETNSRFVQVPSPVCNATSNLQQGSSSSFLNRNLKELFSPRNAAYASSGPMSCPPNMSTLNSPVNQQQTSRYLNDNEDISGQKTVVTCEVKTPESNPQPDIPHRHPFHFTSPNSRLSLLECATAMSSLSTPTKCTSSSKMESPRRKNVTPRRRLIPTTPQSKERLCEDLSAMFSVPAMIETQEIHTEDSLSDFSNWFEQLLHAQPLHETIAANINKAVGLEGTQDVQPAEEIAPPEIILQPHPQHEISISDQIIHDIIDKTQADPVFEALLSTTIGEKLENQQKSEVTSVVSKANITEAVAKTTMQNCVPSPLAICNGSLKTPSKDSTASVFPCPSLEETDPNLLSTAEERYDPHNISLETPLKNDTLTLFSYDSTPDKVGIQVKKVVTISCDNNAGSPNSNDPPRAPKIEEICENAYVSNAAGSNDVVSSQNQGFSVQDHPSIYVSPQKSTASNIIEQVCDPKSGTFGGQVKTVVQVTAAATNQVANSIQTNGLVDSSLILLPFQPISAQPRIDNVAVNLSIGTSHTAKNLSSRLTPIYPKILPQSLPIILPNVAQTIRPTFCKIKPREEKQNGGKNLKKSPEMKTLVAKAFAQHLHFHRKNKRSHIRNLNFTLEAGTTSGPLSSANTIDTHNIVAEASNKNCSNGKMCLAVPGENKTFNKAKSSSKKIINAQPKSALKKEPKRKKPSKRLSKIEELNKKSTLVTKNWEKSAEVHSDTFDKVAVSSGMPINLNSSGVKESYSSSKSGAKENIQNGVASKEKTPAGRSTTYDELSIINQVKKFDNCSLVTSHSATKSNFGDNKLEKTLPLRKRTNSFGKSSNSSDLADGSNYISDPNTSTQGLEIICDKINQRNEFSVKSTKGHSSSSDNLKVAEVFLQPRTPVSKKIMRELSKEKVQEKKPSHLSKGNQQLSLDGNIIISQHNLHLSKAENGANVFTLFKDPSLLTKEALKCDVEFQNVPQYRKTVLEVVKNTEEAGTGAEVSSQNERTSIEMNVRIKEKALIEKIDQSHQSRATVNQKSTLIESSAQETVVLSDSESRREQILAWEKVNSPLVVHEDMPSNKNLKTSEEYCTLNGVSRTLSSSSSSANTPVRNVGGKKTVSSAKNSAKVNAAKRKPGHIEGDDVLSSKLRKLSDVDAFLQKIHG